MADEYIVEGALCTCKHGSNPGKLKVVSCKPETVNGGKRIATSMELGDVFLAPEFGTCTKNPLFPRPCKSAVTKWSNPFTGKKLPGGAYPLMPNSKATCAAGTPDCIEIINHGQIEFPGELQAKSATAVYQSNLDPTGSTMGLASEGQSFNILVNPEKSWKPKPGHYYRDDGTYLGKIGQSENVYITTEEIFSQLKRNEQVEYFMVIEFTKDYNLTNTQLLDRANWIYAEGGYEIPEYYAYTMENLFISVKRSEDKLYEGMYDTEDGRMERQKYFQGGYTNQTGVKFWNLRKTPEQFDGNMSDCIRAIFLSKLRPNLDPTGGTKHWLGEKLNDGAHSGQFFITSRTRRHYFQFEIKEPSTRIERQYSRISY